MDTIHETVIHVIRWVPPHEYFAQANLILIFHPGQNSSRLGKEEYGAHTTEAPSYIVVCMCKLYQNDTETHEHN